MPSLPFFALELIFQSTPSARRATVSFIMCSFLSKYFNPRPPRGGRPGLSGSSSVSKYFNPRPPRGGRLTCSFQPLMRSVFQSTPSARRATAAYKAADAAEKISIHALREEGDAVLVPPFFRRCNFNPRPPRGGRPAQSAQQRRTHRFQSTPSARRATCVSTRADCAALFQSTPSARRAT